MYASDADRHREWQFQKQDAERVVQRLTGVKGVSNLLTVKPRVTPLRRNEGESVSRTCGPAARTTSEIKQKIQQALVRSAETEDTGRFLLPAALSLGFAMFASWVSRRLFNCWCGSGSVRAALFRDADGIHPPHAAARL
jgi:hypothetical protein